MKKFLKLKIKLLSIIFLLSLFLISSCQAFQTSTLTTPKIQPEPTDEVTSPGTETTPFTETEEPSQTLAPTTTPAIVRGQGTPLPSNLEIMLTENVARIQHLATWEIGSPDVIELSKDGQIFAVGTGLGVHLYDTQALYEIAFRETPHGVLSIAFSHDNKFFAVGQVRGSIDIYERNDFSFVKHLEFPEITPSTLDTLNCNFFQEISKLVCVVRTEEKIFINQWSLGDWVHSSSFTIDNGRTSFINPVIGSIGVITEDSLVFQSLFYPEDTKQIDLPDSLSGTFWENFSEMDGDIAPTADGEALVINDGTSIIYWDIFSGEITYQLTDFPSTLPDPCQDVAETCLNEAGEISWICRETAPPPIETIALTPDDIMMLISRNDNITEFRRDQDGLLAWEIESHYTKIAFSPGSEFFFALGEDGNIEKRGSEAGDLFGKIEHFPGKIFDIAFSSDGGEIAAAANNGWIQIYNAVNGQSLGVLEANAHTLDFSPDGELLAAGLEDGTIRVFTLDNGGHFDLDGHLDTINDLKFSDDGEVLLSGSGDCTISLWNVKDQERTKTITPGKDQPFKVLRVDFSPAEVLGYMAGGITGLYAAKEDAKYSLEGLISVGDFAVSQNEQTLAVTGSGISIFTDIQEEGFFTAHLLSVKGNALALNEDGSLLVVATGESLEFWSTKDKTNIYSFLTKDTNYPGKNPVQLTFSPDNSLLALAYQNGLIEIFGVPGN